jgi:Cytochrome c7 and related cytochrome c
VRGRWVVYGVLGLVMSLRLVTPAEAQVSPGPLAAPHQELDAALKCFTCHGKGASMNDRCLDCHKEVAFLVSHGLGLHAQTAKQDCARCHPDHAGREFKMIRFEEGSPDKFDHARSGWPLDGKHAPLKCGDCHKPALRKSEAVPLAPGKGKDAAESFIGLDRACLSCHAGKDVHHGALGTKCETCHDAAAWKPVPRFDHGKTDYPLTGKHAPLQCNACHMASFLKLPTDARGRPGPLYKPVPHKECSPCHADPHNGQLGPACSSCHDTGSWKRVDPKKFNHDKTRYPLRGRHATLECAQCHDARTAWGKKPPFATCNACHKDAHAGTDTLAGKAVDCAACHDVAGFRPSTFTVAQHRATAYPLLGAHARTRCDACHVKNPPGLPAGRLGTAGVLIRMASQHCTNCHADAHGGQLARRPDRGACEPCHTVEAWKPSTFTIRKHAPLRLALLGRHAKIDCAACHGPVRKGLPPLPGPERLGTARVALLLPDATCTACHFDPHGGRFEAGGARPKKQGCLTCHDLNAFSPSTVGVATHAGFGFPLQGAHRAVPCDACHRESKPAPPRPSLLLLRAPAPPTLFALKDGRCETCHKNPHGNQFARRRGGGACERCHNEDVFVPASRFNHNRDSAYPLEGAHARVACDRCHPARRDAAGRRVVIYQPLPKDCKSCHGGKVPQRLSLRSTAPPSGTAAAPPAAHADVEGRS